MDYPKVKPCLDTSEYDLIDELYLPCLKWAIDLIVGWDFSQQGGSHTM